MIEKIKEILFAIFAGIIWLPFCIIILLLYGIVFIISTISDFIHEMIES